MRISDWSSDVCSSDLHPRSGPGRSRAAAPSPTSIGRSPARPMRKNYPWASTHYSSTRPARRTARRSRRSEEHTSELQSLMRISYAVFCLKKKKTKLTNTYDNTQCQFVEEE